MLTTTEPIPNKPVFFRDNLDPDKRERFIDALIAYAAEASAASVLRNFGDIEGFEKVDDSAYQAARDSIKAAKRQVQELVPGGWQIHNHNQAPLSACAP